MHARYSRYVQQWACSASLSRSFTSRLFPSSGRSCSLTSAAGLLLAPQAQPARPASELRHCWLPTACSRCSSYMVLLCAACAACCSQPASQPASQAAVLCAQLGRRLQPGFAGLRGGAAGRQEQEPQSGPQLGRAEGQAGLQLQGGWAGAGACRWVSGGRGMRMWVGGLNAW